MFRRSATITAALTLRVRHSPAQASPVQLQISPGTRSPFPLNRNKVPSCLKAAIGTVPTPHQRPRPSIRPSQIQVRHHCPSLFRTDRNTAPSCSKATVGTIPAPIEAAIILATTHGSPPLPRPPYACEPQCSLGPHPYGPPRPCHHPPEGTPHVSARRGLSPCGSSSATLNPAADGHAAGRGQFFSYESKLADPKKCGGNRVSSYGKPENIDSQIRPVPPASYAAAAK